MSSKTKIVVLRMKEVVYTGLFAAVGLLLILLLLLLFLPAKNTQGQNPDSAPTPSAQPPAAMEGLPENGILQEVSASAVTYLPGIYKTQLILGGQTVEIEVILQKDSISSLRLVNIDDAIATMYPLLQPTMEHICEEVCRTQSIEHITYQAGTKYTSLVLLEAIGSCLERGISPAGQ